MILMVGWREMLSAAPGRNVVSGTLRGTSLVQDSSLLGQSVSKALMVSCGFSMPWLFEGVQGGFCLLDNCEE